MASIILSTVGSAVGSSGGGAFGANIGRVLGRAVGSVIDNRLLSGGTTKIKIRGGRLSDLAVQSSAYGRMIPIVYGTVRIGGNIIWSRPIQETSSTSTSSSGGGGGKGGGGRVSQSTTTYSYSVTLAIAICEGEISALHRIWADAKQLDLSQYTIRTYLGTETQLPDSLIASIEGADATPAHRGLAYVVIENFPLADFGNRIPNFTFEVQKKSDAMDYDGMRLEEEIQAMVLIPGAGEFVYDTQVDSKIPGALVGGVWVQQGNQIPINMHNPTGEANALLALDQLQATCPNVEWVSVVACWFGDSLDAGACVVKPGVEFQADSVISPAEWTVAGFTRSTARLITQVSGAPQYGGTPDDNSLVRLVTELRARGLKVAFYPLLFMDVTGKPWRGELTGSATNVANFFTKTNGYNAFITHYANLMVGKVDAFIIGSELKGLTKVSSSAGVYPAVSALVTLAGTVRGILGSGVTLTYAADWSEYHHTDGGWYHLDPLWASSNIDVVGIDAYFPLTDVPNSVYDVDEIRAGWTSGEGYDFYYSDPARTVQTPLTAAYAWKNLAWFHGNTHVNPNAVATAWTPGMKKIWFTECGFPSVDCCTNQPNVFYDPSTAASAFPYHSKGRVDIRAQRAALMATLAQWAGSSVVERIFLWTWDARPFPYWPDLTQIWNDGVAWKTGHWLQGKLGLSNLAAVVEDLAQRSGLDAASLAMEQISIPLEGYVIGVQQSARQALEVLQMAYFFDLVEREYQLKAVVRGQLSELTIEEEELIFPSSGAGHEALRIQRVQEVELPKRVQVMYVNRLASYQTATQYAQRHITQSREINTLELPLVLSDQTAKNIADITLYHAWLSRTQFEFMLPPQYALLEPSDVLEVSVAGLVHRMRILSTRLVDGAIAVQAAADDVAAYDFYHAPGASSTRTDPDPGLPETQLELLDIPGLPGDSETQATLRVAACGRASGWSGAALYRSEDGGTSYNRVLDNVSASAIGTVSNSLGSATTAVFDEVSTLNVLLLGSRALESVTEAAVLSGANAAVVGNEILQFKTATLIGPQHYQLSGLLRGRLGTEWAVGTHVAGERFVLLDGSLAKIAGSQSMLNLPRLYKSVSYGGTLSATSSQALTYQAVALKPYAPVHLSGTRDGSGNLTINWIRRTRLGGQWQDYVDALLSEQSEAYELEILSGTTVLRTISTTTPTAVYSAASQTSDFGSLQSSVSVRIYQLSSIVGRGTAAVGSV